MRNVPQLRNPETLTVTGNHKVLQLLEGRNDVSVFAFHVSVMMLRSLTLCIMIPECNMQQQPLHPIRETSAVAHVGVRQEGVMPSYGLER